MAAVMERRNGAAVMECPRGRSACEVRGTLCHACSSELQAQLRDHSAAAVPDGRDGLQPLNDGQVFFLLRVKLLAACRDGASFEAAWRSTTTEIIEAVPPRDAAGWAHAFAAVRVEFAAAYAARRARPRP